MHGYWSIDLGILLATATNQLPGFVARLRVAHAGLDDESPADGACASAAAGTQQRPAPSNLPSNEIRTTGADSTDGTAQHFGEQPARRTGAVSADGCLCQVPF